LLYFLFDSKHFVFSLFFLIISICVSKEIVLCENRNHITVLLCWHEPKHGSCLLKGKRKIIYYKTKFFGFLFVVSLIDFYFRKFYSSIYSILNQDFIFVWCNSNKWRRFLSVNSLWNVEIKSKSYHSLLADLNRRLLHTIRHIIIRHYLHFDVNEKIYINHLVLLIKRVQWTFYYEDSRWFFFLSFFCSIINKSWHLSIFVVYSHSTHMFICSW
jgi:hypothetical protein